MQHKTLQMATYILLIIGGLNWGLIGILNVNMVNLILGGSPVVEKLVYVAVGLSAVYDIAIMRKGKVYVSSKKR